MHFRNGEMILGLWPLAFGVLCAWLAHRKNRNAILWGLLGAIFLVFSVIFILCLSPLPGRRTAAGIAGPRGPGGQGVPGVSAAPIAGSPPSVAPPPVVRGFSDVAWHVGVDDVARGPLAFEELRALWKVRAFGFDSYVWTPGMPKWRPVRRIQGMSKALSA